MNQNFKILLLEAAGGSTELIEYEFNKASSCFTVVRVENQEPFIRALQEFGPHLILVDSRLRHSDALIALAYAQEMCPEVPFLFVSAITSPAPLKAEATKKEHKPAQIPWWFSINGYFPTAFQPLKTC